MHRRLSPRITSLLFAVSVLACGTEPESTGPAAELDVLHFSGQTLNQIEPGSRLEVDLRYDNRAYLFVDAVDLDYERVQLVCPDGQSMVMASWLASQERQFNVELMNGSALLVASSAVAEADTLTSVLMTALGTDQDACEPVCFVCTDGAYVCTSTCDWERDDSDLERPSPSDDGAVTPPPSDGDGSSQSAEPGGGGRDQAATNPGPNGL